MRKLNEFILFVHLHAKVLLHLAYGFCAKSLVCTNLIVAVIFEMSKLHASLIKMCSYVELCVCGTVCIEKA